MDVKYDGIRIKSDEPIIGVFTTEDSNTALKIVTDDMQLSIHKIIYKIVKKYNKETIIVSQERLDDLLNRGSIEIIKKEETVSSNNSRLSEID